MEIYINTEISQKSEVCECEHVHAEVVAHVREMMEDTEVLYALSDFLKVMSDSTRIRIMAALDSEEMCVCDLSELLGMTKSAVSHQLKILRHNALVTYKKVGKNVFYSLADDHVRDIIEKALEKRSFFVYN